MQRLSTFADTEVPKLLPSERIELARQVLATLASLHRHDAAHLDLGDHSIWIETPTTVKFSHLLAARFPDVKTLGKTRYQFLATVETPDHVLGVDSSPKCRDVFLAGVAVHRLLFGASPKGVPADWDASIDSTGEFNQLHSWLSQALDMDPDKRFPDASVALSAFNKATATHPTPQEVIAGLERFRGAVRSQRLLISAYPMAGEPIVDNDTTEIWRSAQGESEAVVKLWKQPAWGDLKREGSTILAFLERAASMKMDRPSGLPTVREVLWLGDAFAIVQDWVSGQTLLQLLDAPSDDLRSSIGALSLLKQLIATVDALHDQGIGHGDIKPANIVITAGGDPVLIDAVDFSPRTDGELISSAYAPEAGSTFERDRYALTRIAEEILALSDLSSADVARLTEVIGDCRENEPRLATLLPLLDEADTILKRLESPEVLEAGTLATEINISIQGAPTGPIEPDEGYLFLRVRRYPDRSICSLIIRGAVEELDVRLNDKGQFVSARRRVVEQRIIRRFSAYEFHSIRSSLNIVRRDFNDLAGLLPVLNDPIVKQKLEQEFADLTPPALVDPDDAPIAKPSEEETDERLVEEIAASVSPRPSHQSMSPSFGAP